MSADYSPSRWFEQHFLKMLTNQVGPVDPEVKSLITELLAATVKQHSCLDISTRPRALLEKLRQQSFVGTAEDHQPFVLTEARLYLNRFFQYETEVASMITSRNRHLPTDDLSRLRHQLSEHFSDPQQKLAALLAATRQLSIVTGGPGTGKTSTVVRILSILLDNQPTLLVRLAAPTGKAAMRLAESIRRSTGEIGSDHKILQQPEVTTLHRLLGMRMDGRTYRHGPDNPLVADLLIIDEASMIDLGMMHRLLAALAPDTRILLLGDPDQLPSVDTGNVLADLCTLDPVFSTEYATRVSDILTLEHTADSDYKLTDAVCRLEKSYRFDEGSGIGLLADAVRKGNSTLAPSQDGSVKVCPPVTEAECGETLLDIWPAYIQLLTERCNDAGTLQSAFDDARILCSHRRSFPGVDSINHAIEQSLISRGIKEPDEVFYPGRPVLVLANDYRLDLYNGDIGICISGEDGEQLVAFPGSGEDDQKLLLASRLPAHESCFAMTVHKAQGSEFDHVSLLLRDAENGEDLLTSRELIYTAVTRARQSISLFATPESWQSALRTSSVRVSGMTSFLGGTPKAGTTTSEQLDLF